MKLVHLYEADERQRRLERKSQLGDEGAHARFRQEMFRAGQPVHIHEIKRLRAALPWPEYEEYESLDSLRVAVLRFDNLLEAFTKNFPYPVLKEMISVLPGWDADTAKEEATTLWHLIGVIFTRDLGLALSAIETARERGYPNTGFVDMIPFNSMLRFIDRLYDVFLPGERFKKPGTN